MRRPLTAAAWLPALALVLWAGVMSLPAQAQQVVVGAPQNRASHSFYENIGVNFGFNIPGGQPGQNSATVGLTPLGGFTPNGALQFRQGAGGPVAPLGLGDPNAQANLGFGILGGGGGGAFFGITAGQGSDSSITSTTPTVVLPNGGTGGVFDATQRSFVTGITPVVGQWAGGQPAPTSVLADRLERLYREGATSASSASASAASAAPDPADRLTQAVGGSSTAARGDVSVAEIRRQQAAVDAEVQAEIDAFLRDAQAAEAEGKPAMAIIYYRLAARRATGRQQAELQAKIDEISSLLGR